MGKVWRAHHTALNRDNALKVLPDVFASDPDRLARFRREAQVLESTTRRTQRGDPFPCDHARGRFRSLTIQMTQTVEISLRIPSLRIRREGKEAPETIANGDVRFGKQVELEAIPRPGDVLTMMVSSGGTFECDVVRSDWQHDRNMFVISCRYSKRSISPAEYHAFIGASDWQVKTLL